MTEPDRRDPILVAFGRQVREARIRAGKRSGQFAAELEVSRHSLQDIEAGRRPASDVLYWRIANALELDPSAVLRGVS